MTCPKCGAEENHPTENAVLIRACKVEDEQGTWSQCLVCSGGYNEALVFNQQNHDPDKGWFCERW